MGKLFQSNFWKITFVLIVCGVICIVFGVMDLIDSNRKPLDYSTMTASDIKKNAIVEGDINYNLGAYESIENTRNGRVESTNYRYIIPIGDKEYIGIDFHDPDDVAKMNRQTDETFDMLDGKIEDTETVVHFKGKIKKMTSEDYGYFKDYMSEGGYTDNEIQELGSEYYIQNRVFGEGPLIIGLGVAFLVLGIILCLVIIKKSKTVNNSIQQDSYMTNPENAKEPFIYQNPADFQTPLEFQNNESFQGPENFH